MRRQVVAATLALMLASGCTAQVADPRGIDPEDAQALEQAAHADTDDEPVVESSGTVDDAGQATQPPDGFELLRPADDVADHPLSDLWGLDAFGVFDNGELVFEWSNRDELWTDIVVPVGDSCRAAGPPITEPLFDDPDPLVAAVDSYWNNRSTSGRGTLVSVMCAYVDDELGPVERYEAYLVATDPDSGAGQVVASSDSWHLAADDYDDISELVAHRDAAMAEWARDQGRVDDDPIDPADGFGLDTTDGPLGDREER